MKTRSTITIIILAYSFIALVLPITIYAPIFAALTIMNTVLGQSISSGEVAISFYAGLPLLGAIAFLSLASEAKDRIVNLLFMAPLAEILGMILLVAWFASQLMDMYVKSDVPHKVVTPNFSAPLTSIGLWFSGLCIGVFLCAAVNRFLSKMGEK